VVHHSVKAPDGTQKLLLQLSEGRVVETVGIPVTDERGKQRLTVCVSSQVGGFVCDTQQETARSSH
jgi:23S rRNA (adenine2503-C2)-methyltransferase